MRLEAEGGALGEWAWCRICTKYENHTENSSNYPENAYVQRCPPLHSSVHQKAAPHIRPEGAGKTG
jgi:hypothetical protein